MALRDETAPSEDDKPLDPAVERVRRKLARLMLVSVGTLVIGVVAVLAAVLLRSGGGGGEVAQGDRTIRLVPGARVENATLAPNGLLVRFALPDGSTQLVVLDPATATPRLRVTFSAEPEAGR